VGAQLMMGRISVVFVWYATGVLIVFQPHGPLYGRVMNAERLQHAIAIRAPKVRNFVVPQDIMVPVQMARQVVRLVRRWTAPPPRPVSATK